MSRIRKHGAVLQAWACLALVILSSILHLFAVLLSREQDTFWGLLGLISNHWVSNTTNNIK